MTEGRADEQWLAANRSYLMEAISGLRETLEGFTAKKPRRESRELPPHKLTPPPAIETLTQAFGLSSFERDILLMCAGVELNASFAAQCAQANGDPAAFHPTFALALAALPGAHWSATSPCNPLRQHQLIELLSGDGLIRSPLRIDERVLHHLVGLSYLDERLAGLFSRWPQPDLLPDSHRAVVQRIISLWSNPERPQPVIQLCSHDPTTSWSLAAAAAGALAIGLHVLRIAELPTAAADRAHICRLFAREMRLGREALLIAYDDPESAQAALRISEKLPGPVFLASTARHRLAAHAVVCLDVDHPTESEQRVLWQQQLGPLGSSLNGHLDTLVSHFSLSTHGILSSAAQARDRITSGEAPGPALWDTCRIQTRAALSDLAQRIEPMASWDDLVIQDEQREILREIAAHVRHRSTVYKTWGFRGKMSRGLGISALFSGPSGTGKTMSAEVLARELALDLHCIDLSQVVSKYIGETEKNLRRVFEAAEQAGTILLFDEADALFGRRSEVKDSHDRYANIEVSYLLSRMEAYRGLSILTTNQKSALDPAFLRRLRFFVDFSFPGLEERAELWRRAFPRETPTVGIDPLRLARLHVTGGNIRNIALSAAFLAAELGESVQMKHLLSATRKECAKIERSLSEAEIGGWV